MLRSGVLALDRPLNVLLGKLQYWVTEGTHKWRKSVRKDCSFRRRRC
jgi:hypothetical protein